MLYTFSWKDLRTLAAIHQIAVKDMHTHAEKYNTHILHTDMDFVDLSVH